MLNDQPSSDDPLGRRPFAESIAKVITLQTDSAPQVIAIDGAWGEGKTTVFGFLKTALESRKFEVMEFNPWRHNSEEMMIRALVLGLAETLKVEILNKKDKIAEWAQGDGDWVKESVGAIGDGKFGKLIDFGSKRLRPTIDILTDRLKGELNCRAHRVTILVDDPDRLDADQLMGLFRLVKLIASFEWVTFVLAMDCDAVAKTIGKRLESETEGRRFLEKIVQVPLRLPAIPHSQMLKFTLGLVDQVIGDLKINISEDEAQRFRGVFDGGLMPFVATPRMAKQYANVLRFALGFSSGEVNSVDVMLLEGIRLLLPETFKGLFRCVAPVVDKSIDEMYNPNTGPNQSPDAAAALSAILPSGDLPASKWALSELFSTLFPKSFGTINHSDSCYRDWEAAKRVACEDYMWRYLHCAVPEYDVPDSEIEKMLQAAENGDQVRVNELLREKIVPQRAELGVQKLRRIEDRLTNQQRRILTLAVAANSDVLIRSSGAWQFECSFGRSAIAVAHFIRDFKPLEAREALAAQALNLSRSTLWAVELFEWMPHAREDKEMTQEEKALTFPPNVSNRLGGFLATRIMNDIDSSTENPSIDLLRKFGICIKFGEKDRFRRWVRNRIERSADFVEQIGCVFMTWSYGSSGRTFQWPGNETVLKSMEECFDLEFFRENIYCEEVPVVDDWDRGLTPKQIVFRMMKLVKEPEFHEGQLTAPLTDVDVA